MKITAHNDIPIFDLEKVKFDFSSREFKRIWFVTNIHDDRAFPQGFVESVRTKIKERYRLILEKKYIPYEATLAAKASINRHKKDSYRITVSLYESR